MAKIIIELTPHEMNVAANALSSKMGYLKRDLMHPYTPDTKAAIRKSLRKHFNDLKKLSKKIHFVKN